MSNAVFPCTGIQCQSLRLRSTWQICIIIHNLIIIQTQPAKFEVENSRSRRHVDRSDTERPGVQRTMHLLSLNLAHVFDLSPDKTP